MRTLAEPNLTAISGETAKFLAGGEFPVPVAGRDGQIAVSWKTFGVNVSFKPVVMTRRAHQSRDLGGGERAFRRRRRDA